MSKAIDAKNLEELRVAATSNATHSDEELIIRSSSPNRDFTAKVKNENEEAVRKILDAYGVPYSVLVNFFAEGGCVGFKIQRGQDNMSKPLSVQTLKHAMGEIVPFLEPLPAPSKLQQADMVVYFIASRIPSNGVMSQDQQKWLGGKDIIVGYNSKGELKVITTGLGQYLYKQPLPARNTSILATTVAQTDAAVEEDSVF